MSVKCVTMAFSRRAFYPARPHNTNEKLITRGKDKDRVCIKVLADTHLFQWLL